MPRCRSHLPSAGRKNTQQENIPRKNNVCIVREITKINKKSAGHGTNIKKKKDGEIGILVAIGADAIVRADRRRPADPAERGPDFLLDANDACSMAKYLRAGWKSEQEIGGRGGCPVKGQWHGKLKGRRVLKDPGWTCVQYVKTGRTSEDIFMRVMFDTIREHSVAVKLGLRVSGGPRAPGRRSRRSPGLA